MEDFSFNKIGEITTENQKNVIIKADNPCDEEELSINVSGTFIFDPTVIHKCKKLFIEKNINVTIVGLHLNGSIKVKEGSTLNLDFSHISNPQKGIDYIIDLTSCEMVSRKSSFSDASMYGFSVDDGTKLKMTECDITNCNEIPLIVTGGSIAQLNSCTIDKSSSDLCFSENGIFIFNDVTFKNSEYTAIRLFEQGKAIVIDCKFIDNKCGALYAKNSYGNILENCEILNSRDTAILLETSSARLHNVHIKKVNGNGVYGSRCSFVTISECHFEESQWPLVALCENTSAIVEGSVFENSLMSGFIVRSSEHLLIKNSIVRSCAETGLRATNSRNVIIRDTVIGDTVYSAMDVSDLSKVVCENCVFAGGSKNGISVFTGSELQTINCTAIGPFNTALWVHHAGSAFFTGFVYAPSPVPIMKGKWEMFANAARLLRTAAIKDPVVVEKFEFDHDKMMINQNIEVNTERTSIDQRICRVDTKYAVEITNSFVVGVGNYEMHANNLNKIKENDYTPAICMKCGKNEANSYFCPCGHALYCNECWESIPDNEKPQCCHLCHLKNDKVIHHLYQVGEDDNCCPICYANDINSIIIPCGHKICNECSSKWLKESYECPFCREENVYARPLMPYE